MSGFVSAPLRVQHGGASVEKSVCRHCDVESGSGPLRRLRRGGKATVMSSASAGQESELSRLRETTPAALEFDAGIELLKERSHSPAEFPSTSARPSAAAPAGPGSVFLVGTGPGDPMLLTLRAVTLMKQADVVLYDRLVSDEILRFVSEDAMMIYVGKQSGFHTRSQDEIHQLLLQFAEAGKTILRLKGGDPYVFGRGGEELEFLDRRGIKVNCVPGITAASGIGAELGIPMTHRGYASSVRYVTGHIREDGGDVEEIFDQIADPFTTIVVYMGLGNLKKLTRRLLGRGLRADTPAVAVERGTLPDQRAIFAELSSLDDKVERANMQSPTLLIIGKVVSLAGQWQERDLERVSEPSSVELQAVDLSMKEK